MKKLIYFLSLIITLAFVIQGCQKDSLNEQIKPESLSQNINYKSVEAGCEYPLIAGQNIEVGTVTSIIDLENETLTVEYLITDPDNWCLMQTHLDVQLSYEGFPTTPKGNPKIGHFQYGEELEECTDGWSLEINISDFIPEDGSCPELFIAAHAVVKELSCYQTGVLYGIHRNDGKIYGIDVVTGTAWEEFTVNAPPTGSAKPNGLAYDDVNQRMYYCSYQSTPTTLYFWDYVLGSEVIAGDLGDVQIADAGFYDGKYYYIESSNSDDLYEVVFDVDGFVLSNTKIADIASEAHGWTFNGDIAIKDGIIYGWGKCGIHNVYEFFTYNLVTGDFAINTTAYQGFSMQLAFGSDGVLYGHKSNASGNAYFYEVDITNGNLSNEILIDPDLAYTDCASGMQCVPETETAWAGDINFPGNSWATYFICNNCEDGTEDDCYQEETAWGGITEGEGSAWWFYYVNDGTAQTIWAGQTNNAGTVTWTSENGGTITIELTDGWELQPVAEAVKIQGYETIPDSRPPAGDFTTYKGTSLVVTGVGTSTYYAIHLDVRKQVPCP